MSSEQTTYRVRPGDSMGRIATHFGLTLRALLNANPQIANPNRIKVGDLVHIPSASPAPANVATNVAVNTGAPSTSPAPVSTAAATTRTAPATTPTAAAAPRSPQQDEYAAFFARHGINLDQLPAGERAILGLRVPTSTKANKGLGLYDDRIVVTWRGEDGTQHFREFAGTTEPSARYQGRLGRDADGDGDLDMGCLSDGVYDYMRSRSAKYGDVLSPCADINVMRDVDGDGDFDETDRSLVRNESALNSKLSILFHKGGNSLTGSAGCQTMRPADFQKFWGVLGGQKRFRYVLVTVV